MNTYELINLGKRSMEISAVIPQDWSDPIVEQILNDMNSTLPKNAQVYKQGYLDNNSDKYTMIYLVPFKYSEELKKLATNYARPI
jgi:hypothetical protein